MNVTLETITINGVEYVQKSALDASAPQIFGDKRIIVADRGLAPKTPTGSGAAAPVQEPRCY